MKNNDEICMRYVRCERCYKYEKCFKEELKEERKKEGVEKCQNSTMKD